MGKGGIAGLLCAVMACSDASIAGAMDPAGCITPGLEPFDAEMSRLMEKWDVPGGSLAVSHNGRVLLVRGYGLADKSTGARVTPATKFRLGSMSKPITAVAILKLVEESKLRLDDKILPLLGALGPPAEAIHDPRVHAITVRHLLQHTGGFDRAVSGDPMFMPWAGAAVLRQNAKMPPTCQAVLRDALEGQLALPGVAEGMVPAPYGWSAIEEMDAYGGWIGAPIDYLRFILAIDGQRGPRLLNEASVREMLSRPNIPDLDSRRPAYYGLGFSVRILDGGGVNWWHTGVQLGFHAFALRTARGHSWVSAFNSLPRDLDAFWRDLDSSLWAAAKRVARWPEADSSHGCPAYDPK